VQAIYHLTHTTCDHEYRTSVLLGMSLNCLAFADDQYTYSCRDGQAELTWLVGYMYIAR